jgi:hypothetical protein
MAKLLTGNSTNQSIVFSNTVWRAIANVAAIGGATASNTNIELVIADFVAQGLRQAADLRMSDGEKDLAGIAVSYLEGTLKANSE